VGNLFQLAVSSFKWINKIMEMKKRWGRWRMLRCPTSAAAEKESEAGGVP
jgi:hypothetical protein